jgi:large subunit ribosomal protein L18
MNAQNKAQARARRKRRVRKNMHGTAARPRMTVFKSNKHIYVQVIDDDRGATMASTSTLSEAIRGAVKELNKRDAATKIGEAIAEACKAAKINQVVFDRNGYPYTGRVAAVADGARSGGLEL